MQLAASTALGDYLLDPDHCDPYTNVELTISLRLGFRQINPSGGAASGTYNDYGRASGDVKKIVPWTPAAWSAWIKEFVRSAEHFWNGRLWLSNNFPEFEFQHASVTYRPNVDCKLDLYGEPVARSDYHHIVDVVKLDPSVKWFGSHATLYDNLDIRPVQKKVDSSGRPIMQLAHVHEIGHLLGLSHVDVGKPHCAPGSDTNADQCYGVIDADKHALMGGGIALRHEHGNPWRRAIMLLTNKGSLATTNDWATMKLRIYPRTPAEAAANRQITTRPVR